MAPTDARLLAVEDDGEILQVLDEVAGLAGYDITGIAHPGGVLDLARRIKPDLFLIDIMLPQRSGIEVAQDLLANGFAGTPIIGTSASNVMLNLAERSGLFQAVLAKPYDLDALIVLIERLLGSSRATEAVERDIERRVLQTLDQAEKPLRYEELEERCGMATREGRKLIFQAVYRLVDAGQYPLVDVAGGRVRITAWGRQHLAENLPEESDE